jgi:cytochrome c oxidase cbb3-type subunit 2
VNHAVVARPEALDLVAYLQGLQHVYSVLTPAQVKAASRALPASRQPVAMEEPNGKKADAPAPAKP